MLINIHILRCFKWKIKKKINININEKQMQWNKNVWYEWCVWFGF